MGIFIHKPLNLGMGLKKIEEPEGAKRKISITLDPYVEDRIRKIQSRLIDITGNNWSFSELINLSISCGLLSAKKLSKSDWDAVRAMLEGKKFPFDNKSAKDYAENLVAKQ